MSLFLQTLVLRGILSSQQERAVESFSDGEEFHMKKILTQYGVCALAVALMVTLAQAQTPAPGTSFRDCSNGCPEMMVVQQGRFTMGAPAGEEARENLPNELRGSSVPQHLIKIRHKLAIAKFDVTR